MAWIKVVLRCLIKGARVVRGLFVFPFKSTLLPILTYTIITSIKHQSTYIVSKINLYPNNYGLRHVWKYINNPNAIWASISSILRTITFFHIVRKCNYLSICYSIPYSTTTIARIKFIYFCFCPYGQLVTSGKFLSGGYSIWVVMYLV